MVTQVTSRNLKTLSPKEDQTLPGARPLTLETHLDLLVMWPKPTSAKQARVSRLTLLRTSARETAGLRSPLCDT